MAEQADISREFHGRVGEMSIAVPIILAVALAASLYGQVGVTWPNYPLEQNEEYAKSEEAKEKAEKEAKENAEKAEKEAKEKAEKAEKAAKEKAEKSKFGKFGKNSNTAAPQGRRDARPKHQE
jgi:stringent starvation protein B